jgi:tripartite ATP-independent transporter DctP family solute receptor
MTTSGAVMQTLVPVAGINAVPFAFKDYAEVWAAMDGDLGAHVRSAVEPRGLYLFPRSLDNGFRNITTSTKPIEKVEDLQNLKIRVPPAPLWVSMFKALGASPTSISLAELYSALQTKVVDGQENPLVQIETVKIYEVQKYCSMTGHVWDGNWVAANGKRWSALPEDVRKLISARFDAAAVKQREDVARLNTELETSLKQKGLTFNYPEKAPFRDALTKAGFYAEWKQKYGAEPWSKLEKYAGTLGA